MHIQAWLLAVLVVLGTIALYWPATGCDFTNCDDPEYVTANSQVQSGLNGDTVIWAFCNPVVGNWHPLTVLSHMLACQLFGLNPWGHHLLNVLLHALNAALVFVLLRQLSGAVWRSLLVAALFAVHPLHVESVAWIAERKDVLSGFFGLLSLIFYARYAQKRSSTEGRRSSAGDQILAFDPRRWTLDYHLALFCLTLGLMSKPMLVTWPFVMLLLDYWPLCRIQLHPESVRGSTLNCTLNAPARDLSEFGAQLSTIWQLVREKIPFFVVAAAASYVTFVVQQQGGAVMPMENLPLGARFGNVLVSYCRYLGKLFWPVDLAVFYPYPGHWPLATVLLAGLLLVVFSLLVIVKRRQYPFLLVGWLWFIGMLVPVIGLVQVGIQAMADRYAYLPSLGLLILAIWGAYELTLRSRYHVIVLSLAGLAAIALCLGLTRQQLGYWHDSETLLRHALAVTENNSLVHNTLGNAFLDKNRIDDAISEYQEAVRLSPGYAEAHLHLGIALAKKGQLDEAINQFQEVVLLEPNDVDAHYDLATALYNKGRMDEAIRQYQEVIRLRPDDVEAQHQLDKALNQKGQADEAIGQLEEAIRLKPDSVEPYDNLGDAFAARGRFEEAIEYYRQAIQINSNRPETFVHLGVAFSQLGRTREAIAQYQEALKLNPNLVGALNNLAWVLAASSNDALRNGAEAVRLSERACELTHHDQPMFIGTLAAAYAECGRFPEAVAAAEKAEQLATAAGLTAVAAKNRQLLELYRAGKPYHEPRPPNPKPE
jgi:Flp pilus assembly protein TadD